MRIYKKSFSLIGVVLFLSLLPIFFNNCAGAKQDEITNQNSSSVRSTGDINTFTQNPPLLEGSVGFQFLLNQYLAPNCMSCHMSSVYFKAPFFDLANVQKSYELSKSGLTKQDMIMRVTNNHFCPTCTLNPSGEVYQAIMYWLDHR